jgi:hypothetical protein
MTTVIIRAGTVYRSLRTDSVLVQGDQTTGDDREDQPADQPEADDDLARRHRPSVGTIWRALNPRPQLRSRLASVLLPLDFRYFAFTAAARAWYVPGK